MPIIYNGTDYYYRKNLQGDIIAILNTNGTKVVEYTYNAWGEVLGVTGSLANTIGRINPFRYRGYYYDTETGFYYLQSRYYDPVVGKFLNADTINNADPFGELYIKARDLQKYVNAIKDIMRAFSWAGGWRYLANLIAPNIGLIFSWINTIPFIGWVIFAYIMVNATVIAIGVAQAYFGSKGVEFWVSWGFVRYKIR